MRLFLLTAIALSALLVTPSTAQPPVEKLPAKKLVVEKADDGLTLKIRLLEERAARAEERLARLEKVTGVGSPGAIAIGDLAVNLAEERMNRFLRVKIAIRVSDANHPQMTAEVERKRAELRNWAITYLAGLSLKDVSGSKAILQIQDEMKKGFGKILGDGKENPVLEVLFVEYLVQVQ